MISLVRRRRCTHPSAAEIGSVRHEAQSRNGSPDSLRADARLETIGRADLQGLVGWDLWDGRARPQGGESAASTTGMNPSDDESAGRPSGEHRAVP